MPKNTTQQQTAGSLRSPALQTPKLRFPGFSGVWEEKRFKNQFNFLKTNSFSRSELNDSGEVINIHYGDIHKSSKSHFDIQKEKLSYLKLNETKGDFIHEGDLIIADASEDRFDVGKAIEIVNIGDKKVVSGLHTFLARPNEKTIGFFGFLMGTKSIKKQLWRIATGASVLGISKTEVEKIKINLPPLPEQEKIASFLGSVDQWVEHLKSEYETLQTYKKGMMQKIFSQQIRFKDDEGNDFPEWEEKRLGEVFLGEKGSGLSKEKVIENGEHECILYGELYTTYKEVISDIKSRTNSKEGTFSQVGDLLVPCSTTTIGIDLANITALNKKDILLGGDITILRGKKEISNIFYAYYLSNFKKNEIARYAQGVTIIHLYYSHFKNMKIDLPSLPEQQKIAEFLSSVDKLLESKQQQITKVEEWKKGLMQGLFI